MYTSRHNVANGLGGHTIIPGKLQGLTKQYTSRMLIGLLLSLYLAGCGGGNDQIIETVEGPVTGDLQTDPDQGNGEVGVVAPFDAPSESLPDELAVLDQVSLRVQPDDRCVVVGQTLSLSVTRADNNTSDATFINTTAFTQFTQSLGESLQLISRGDESAEFNMQQQDIVGLTAEIENGSVTAFLAGFASETPTGAILRKPVVGGCLYAFRIPDYCVTGFAKGGPLSFSRDGISMSAEGCELQNPNNLPVVEIGG